jgi:hypothetical protein
MPITLLLLLSFAAGAMMVVDGRSLALLTDGTVHLEAKIITTLIATTQVHKRQTTLDFPDQCYDICSKLSILREQTLELTWLYD